MTGIPEIDSIMAPYEAKAQVYGMIALYLAVSFLYTIIRGIFRDD